MTVVADTSFLVALLDEADVWHAPARRLAEDLDRVRRRVVIPDCVLNEVYTVFARRARERGLAFAPVAEKIRERLEDLPRLRAYRRVGRLHRSIVEEMVTSEGRLSYHDALIVLVMRENGLTEIASFDEDFDAVLGIRRVSRREIGETENR